MGLTYTRYDEGIVWVADGIFSPEEALKINEDLAMQSSLDQIQYFIINLSGMTEYRAESDMTELNARYSHSLSIYARRVVGIFVVSDPAFSSFPVPYIEAMKKIGSKWELGVCATYAEAKALIESKLGHPIP